MMSNFSPAEIAYLESQRLGRLATVNAAGEPHVVPMGFRYNPELDTIDIGGLNLGNTKKVRDIASNPNVAFVVDDVLPPWQARGIEIRGKAQFLPEGGQSINPNFRPEMIRITPTRIISWGIDTDARNRSSRKVAQSS
jgi:pyridoxamine 5'-phosphate oxidase family protein